MQSDYVNINDRIFNKEDCTHLEMNPICKILFKLPKLSNTTE